MPEDKNIQVHLIHGTSEYEVDVRARKRVEQLCPPDQQALGLEIVNGRVDNTAEAIAAVRRCLESVCTVGLLGEGKVVWLKDANFLGENQVGKTADTKKEVKRLAEEIKRGLPVGQHLVISAEKVSKRSSFYKTCEAVGQTAECSRPEKSHQAEMDAKKRIQQLFSKGGYRIDPDAAEAFVVRTGTDARMIVVEAEKLMTYMGDDRRIGIDEVKDVVTISRESLIWDLTDAFGNKDVGAALHIVRRLLAQKESHIGLIISLENHFRLLELFRVCIDQGWVRAPAGSGWRTLDWVKPEKGPQCLEGLGQDLRKIHPYRALKLYDQARRFSQRELKRARSRLLRTHEMMVSSSIPSELMLEITILNLLGRSRALA